jgi:hypothetical protein
VQEGREVISTKERRYGERKEGKENVFWLLLAIR